MARKLQALGIAMAPVLSKDVADIEVPTARGLARGGRGAQLVGARKGAAATAGRGKEWAPRETLLPREVCGGGGAAEEPAPVWAGGEKSGSPRLQGCPSRWDLAVYFGVGVRSFWVAVEELEEFEGDGLFIRAFISQSISHLLFFPCKRFGIPVCYPHLQSLNSAYLQRWRIEIMEICM